jgi:hypothetical protein
MVHRQKILAAEQGKSLSRDDTSSADDWFVGW